ncbi:MAG: glutamate-5-semialdehyde dehydrogenase [Planctomycetes bacterium]|nr:glutamate-5-semialdehyde dehydrogenase [Planctomycetota bacterium]
MDACPDSAPRFANVNNLSIKELCLQMARKAKEASQLLALVRSDAKDRWLQRSAEAIEQNVPPILQENARDIEGAEKAGLTSAMIDRLRLTPARLRAAATGLRQVAGLPDPIGRVRDGHVRPNGLEIQKVAVPLGVIFFLYESRPNVTLDAAALCVKSGNAVILRGGKEAIYSNTILHRLLSDALRVSGLPADAVQLVPTLDREAVGHFLKLNDYIDLAIPRGGESLIRRVAEEAKMPVLKHYLGNCHVYVDRAADLDMAEKIVVNAKCQRPGVCNAMESLLVHAEVAERFIPRIGAVLSEKGVELRGCAATRNYLLFAKPATEADYAAEYCDLILSIKVVPNLDAAITHVNHYGSKHTDAIVTTDLSAAQRFTQSVDSAAVVVNASTRFNDGFELGLGAEIGISTDKFHARGPCGLEELTSYKYVVIGTGQVRE